MRHQRLVMFFIVAATSVGLLLILGASIAYFYTVKSNAASSDSLAGDTSKVNDTLTSTPLYQIVEDSPCTTDPAYNIDFSNSMVTENTLHLGGEFRINNVGDFDGRMLDLVLVNAPGADYYTLEPENNGVFGNFAEIQIVNDQMDDPRLDGIGDFVFCFRDSATDEPVTIESFHMSFFDFDERGDRGFEKLTIDQNEAVAFQRYQPSEVIPLCENLQPLQEVPPRCPDGDNICFFSSTSGGPDDNPDDPGMMTPEQLQRTLMFTFRDTACFEVEYSQLCNDESCRTGGNMIFAGTATQVAEDGECDVTQQQTATSQPASSTMPPSRSPSSESSPAPNAMATPNPDATPSPDMTPSPNTDGPAAMPPTRDPSSESTPSPNSLPTPTRDPATEVTPSPNVDGPSTIPPASRTPSLESTPSPDSLPSIPTLDPATGVTPSPNVDGPSTIPPASKTPSSETTPSPDSLPSTPTLDPATEVTPSPNVDGPSTIPPASRTPSSETTPSPNSLPSIPTLDPATEMTSSPNIDEPTIMPPTRNPSLDSTPNPNNFPTPSPDVNMPPSPTQEEPTRNPTRQPTRRPSQFSTKTPTHSPNSQFSTKRPTSTTTGRTPNNVPVTTLFQDGSISFGYPDTKESDSITRTGLYGLSAKEGKKSKKSKRHSSSSSSSSERNRSGKGGKKSKSRRHYRGLDTNKHAKR